MQPDKLEKYISDHREEFNDQEPGTGVWEKIHKRKAPVFNIGWRGMMWRAAAVIIIFFSSYVFFRLTEKKPEVGPGYSQNELTEDKPALANDLKEAEIYYSAQIEFVKQEAIRVSNGDPRIREMIDTEMVDLDQIYAELKNDLKDNTDNEEVIQAMIQNYRIKLQVLEEILQQLKQSKEPISSSTHENEAVAL